ncbi:MAG: hypothetical protein JRC86_11870 [Deltaproteobacteria bacterium]|nr:hypothetical protein [Deltaproteobacteria bacterium]
MCLKRIFNKNKKDNPEVPEIPPVNPPEIPDIPDPPPPPPPPPPRPRLKENKKPARIPKMVMAVVDLPTNPWRGGREAIKWFAKQIGEAGVDYVRVFGTGWQFGKNPDDYIAPFLMTGGKYDFTKPNPAFDEAFKYFRDELRFNHVGLWVDLYDRCSENLTWNPFKNNCNDIHGFYGYESATLSFIYKHWVDRWIGLLDPAKDIIGLGNEIRFPGENNVQAWKVWAEKWGMGHAKYLIRRGFKPPFPFSGSKITAHKLHGYLSGEEHPEYDPGHIYRLSCNVIHGIGLEEHVPLEFASPSVRRLYGYSDDGVGTNNWNKIPIEKRGLCEGNYACTANTAERIKTIRAFNNKIPGRLWSVEFLPRDISMHPIANLNPEVSLDIYWQLCKELWNFDIRRRLSLC